MVKTEDEFVHPSRRALVDRSESGSRQSSERRHGRERSHRESRDRESDWERPRERERERPRERERERNRERYRARSRSPKREPRSPKRESRDRSASEEVEREQPNYEPSGALLGDKIYKGVASLQYAEPPDARKPDRPYRMYVFKNDDIVDTYTLNQQSAYLFGRDRSVVDLPLDHPSCSKQHAVLQYRLVVEEAGMFGEPTDRVAPFIYDLGSANGTTLNGSKLPAREYVEVKVKDTVMFGLSSREYLLLCEDL